MVEELESEDLSSGDRALGTSHIMLNYLRVPKLLKVVKKYIPYPPF